MTAPNWLTARVDGMRGGDFGKLAVLMAAAFIDMVGGLMVFPLFPFYASKFGANGLQVSLLITAFAVMQLVSAPLWGRVSDRYGRKPALLVGLIASAFSYVIFAYANSYWLLLLCRLVQGAGGGTTGVIQAYVADAVEPKNRTRGLSWLSSATNVGVVLGPLLGAQAIRLGEHGPGLIAALLCMINIWFAMKYLTERQTAKARAKSQTARSPMTAVLHVLEHPGEPASRLIWMYAICMGAFYGINPTLSLYLKDYWGVTALTIGYFFAYIGLLNVVVRLFLVGPVVDRLGEVRTARAGTFLLGLGILLLPLIHRLALPGLAGYLPLALVVALIPLGTAFNFPATTGLLSRVVGEHERGLYMGVQQTYAGIARAIYPLFAGYAWDHYKPIVPFGTSAALVMGTIWLGFGLQKFSAHSEEAARQDTAEEPAAQASERR
jgi:multidrug resistance protein